MNNGELIIAVVSDLHCKHSSKDSVSKTTYLYSDNARFPVIRHPVSSLLETLSKDSIKADVLLCPGDITDKADQQGLITGWSFLEEIKLELNAEILAATIGNHDVASRIPDQDPFTFLRNLKSNYPIDDQELIKNFWSDGFYIVKKHNYVIVVYNSSWNHTDSTKASKSKIDEATLEKIENKLIELDSSINIRIAMSHHHPLKHFNMDYTDDDVIDKGDKFLNLLDKFHFKLVIHGHKHDPRLSYHNSLPVLCAGSFSSQMNLNDLGAKNLFHLIFLSNKDNNGKIKSWEYTPRNGWQIKNDTYFPCYTGFGFRDDINLLAGKCAEWFSTVKKNKLCYYADMLKKFPEMDYLIPADQTKLNDILYNKYDIELVPALPSRSITISKLRK